MTAWVDVAPVVTDYTAEPDVATAYDDSQSAATNYTDLPIDNGYGADGYCVSDYISSASIWATVSPDSTVWT